MRKNIFRNLTALFFISALCFSTPCEAKAWKASIAQMPFRAESHEKGALPDLIRALEKSSGQKIDFEVVPFARSMDNVIRRKVDFHMPLIQRPSAPRDEEDYDYSTTTIYHVNFVLYTTAGLPITPENVSQYKVETDLAHVNLFDFPIKPSTSLESSLRKVSAGRIDAFIFADSAADPIIKARGLHNIKRQLFKRYDVKIVLPKGERDGPTDQFLTKEINILKESGELDRIIGKNVDVFDPWQPPTSVKPPPLNPPSSPPS